MPRTTAPLIFLSAAHYSTAGFAIRDHNGQTLAQLSPAGPDRFEGKTGAAQDIVLSRQ